MKLISYFLLYFVFAVPLAMSQDVKGTVYQRDENNNKEPLIGASVYWLIDGLGTTTNLEGQYVLKNSSSINDMLVFSYIGFDADTVNPITYPNGRIDRELTASVSLQAIEVVGKQEASSISTFAPINMEQINAKELEKAACCNLSESFETNATIDVNFTDAVSGSKKIQLLGLDGIYAQMLFENMPMIRGLSASRGLSYIPGTWIESIQITKGTGSVVYGYESMTGQVNLDFQKPDKSEQLYLNLYGNEQGRKEGNLHLAQQLDSSWSSLLLVHASDLSQKNDHNNDGFLDMPLKTQYNVLNRWKYAKNRYKAQFGVRALTEESTGGQKSFNPSRDEGSLNAYGVGIESQEAEVFFKNGLLFPQAPQRTLVLMGSAKQNTQDYYYGLRNYSGEERTAYVNLIFQSSFFGYDHLFKFGGSYLYDEFDEVYVDSAFQRTEKVPGVFMEYTYTHNDKITLVAGMRADEHNLYGTQFTPRLHFKYNLRPLTVFRVSGGSGFRTANVFAENASVFASSRRVVVEEQLKPEKSINGGTSFTHKFKLLNKSTSINADYYHTSFENQVVVDLENPRAVRFYNLKGNSFSNSWQLDISMEVLPRFDVKVAGKIYEIKTTYDGTLKNKPLVKNSGGLLNASYTTRFEKWQFDATMVFYGSGRLPETGGNPEALRLNDHTDPYQTIHAQITRRFKLWEVYLGVENLLNYIQPNAIVAANDPFGRYFDASMIWGPLNGRTIYTGLRFKIK
jgi:outer membrane receptor for ferrienterochelin and colicins